MAINLRESQKPGPRLIEDAGAREQAVPLSSISTRGVSYIVRAPIHLDPLQLHLPNRKLVFIGLLIKLLSLSIKLLFYS